MHQRNQASMNIRPQDMPLEGAIQPYQRGAMLQPQAVEAELVDVARDIHALLPSPHRTQETLDVLMDLVGQRDLETLNAIAQNPGMLVEASLSYADNSTHNITHDNRSTSVYAPTTSNHTDNRVGQVVVNNHYHTWHVGTYVGGDVIQGSFNDRSDRSVRNSHNRRSSRTESHAEGENQHVVPFLLVIWALVLGLVAVRQFIAPVPQPIPMEQRGGGPY